MVKPNAKHPKQIRCKRSYRTFLLIGLGVLLFQIFFVARFLPINKTAESQGNVWQLDEGEIEQEVEANSAGKVKSEGFDDEDGAPPNRNRQRTTNQTHSLRYELLDFVPACSIVTKEAVSAVNRAKTQKCKQLISNITCLSLDGNLYPKELNCSCPADGYVAGKQLGCFQDDKNYRLLSGYFGVNRKLNSPKYCLKLCLQSGFPYAGVEYSDECFCGIDEPASSSKLPDSSCNMRCPGDSYATCGGYYTANIFQTGIKKFIPQIANTEAPNGTNSSVKIVFLLTLNGRAVRQVRRLLKILYHLDHYYYIHVDVRQDYLYRELLVLEKQLPNVRLTRRRFATIWGGASLLEMLRSCMWELLNFPEWRWDFVLNLSESDFPVKTVTRLTQFLSQNRGRNFVKSHGREVQRFIQKQGLDKTFVECETRMWRIGDRTLPYGIQVDGGSDWIALSRSFIEYVAKPQPDELITGLLRIFKYTLLPAESFFHTALRNSKFCNTYIDNNLHVTNWKRKLGCKCQYKQVVDWCGCSPNDFRLDDWPRIQNTLSRQLYFARKFEPIINQAVILQLELWLFDLEQPSKVIPNLYGYWQSEYHHLDLGGVPNDGLLNIGNSVKRQMFRLFKKTNATCNFDLSPLHQVHSYHYNDTYKYTLFTFKLNNKTDLEIAMKPINQLTVTKKSPLMERMSYMVVSSHYDQKEQLSRNFLRVLTPQSEPELIYRFNPTYGAQNYNLTSLWISPVGKLHDVVDFSVEESTLFGHVKPSLKQPLLPGKWTVKVIYKGISLVDVGFLVTPLEFFSGQSVSETQAPILNGGSTVFKDPKSYEAFLPLDEVDLRLSVSLKNSRRYGDALSAWIDELIPAFFHIQKLCASASTEVCGVKVTECAETNWSSLAPDPKSTISAIDRTTGTFGIW